MDKVLTIVILSSGRLVYFKKTVNSLRKTRIDQNQTQILLFLNGFGNEIKEDYREFLQNSGFDFKIFNEKGIKHSELVRLAIYKSREFDHILLCEDDWIFSPNLSINEINRMKELSFFYRQVCFSNFERLNLIKKGEVNQAYFTMNPSIISKLVRNKLIEDYDWVGDMSILDELEKNFAKTIGGDFGQSHYLFESSYFIVKHIDSVRFQKWEK